MTKFTYRFLFFKIFLSLQRIILQIPKKLSKVPICWYFRQKFVCSHVQITLTSHFRWESVYDAIFRFGKRKSNSFSIFNFFENQNGWPKRRKDLEQTEQRLQRRGKTTIHPRGFQECIGPKRGFGWGDPERQKKFSSHRSAKHAHSGHCNRLSRGSITDH